jgi:hypothetical protein
MISGSSTNFCAIGTVCFGSDCESSHFSPTCRPLIPPAALILVRARSKPCFQSRPYSALGPVTGPDTPK